MDLFLLLHSLWFVFALSLDTFTASFASSSQGIQISQRKALLISFISSIILLFSLLMGNILQILIPDSLISYLCFLILFFISLSKFLSFFLKMWIKKSESSSPKVSFHFLNFYFLLQLHYDATQADIDNSKDLNTKEALALAISLSLDGLTAGIGSKMSGIYLLFIPVFAFLFSYASLSIGSYTGSRIHQKYNLDLSYVSGILFLLLAFEKLF